MHQDYYVYVLFGTDAIPYYVGKGRRKRAFRHSYWAGYDIPTVKVAEGLTNREALTIEKMFIRAIGRRPNGPLINKNPGGTGPETHTDEFREKARQRHLGKQYALGHKHTPEVIETIRAASSGRKYPNRKPMSEWNYSSETLARKEEARRLAEERAATSRSQKISLKLRGRPQSPEHKAKTVINLGKNQQGLRWITNGVVHTRARDPIPEGWWRGTLRHSESSRETTGLAGSKGNRAMRLRRLTPDGDYVFGSGQQDFWRDVPDGVGQWVMSRLRLNLGECFWDTSEGTAWATMVLGERTQATRDAVVYDRVNTTPNVTTIYSYGSTTDPNTRTWSAAMTIDTAFGAVQLGVGRLPGVLPPFPAPPGGPSRLLGVTGRPGTTVAMTPANIARGGQQDITDFVIARMDGRRYT